MGREIRRVPARWKHKQRIKNQYHPEGWKIEVQYRPMYQYTAYEEAVDGFKKDVKEWLEGWSLWQKGFYKSYDGTVLTKEQCYKKWLEGIEEERKKHNFRPDYRREERKKYELDICNYEDIAGEIPRHPDPDDYMPSGKWWQLYENVSEGTPLSPPFPSPEKLIEWLTNNKDFWGNSWTKEQAEAMVRQGSTLTLVTTGDGKVLTGQEALTEKL